MVTSTWQCSFCLEGAKLWCLHVWNCGSGTDLGPGDGQLGRWSPWLRGAHTGALGRGGASRCRVLAGFFLSSSGATCGHGSSSDDAKGCLCLAWCFEHFRVLFSIFVFQHRAASWKGRVISQYNQSLCVNITSKEVKGWVAEAEPSSWLVSAAAPLGCLLAVHSLFLLGHEPPPWLGKSFFWWSPNPS